MAILCGLFLDGGPEFSAWRLALFVGLYALVSRVEFEIGSGSAVPTQLVLVPMLFALPIGLVPLAVAAGLCCGRSPTGRGRCAIPRGRCRCLGVGVTRSARRS